MLDPAVKPSAIVRYLDQYVIGQEEAKKILAVAVYAHYRKIEKARADQTETRREAGLASLDGSRGLIKFNPLFDWSRTEVLDAVAAADVPVNALHAQGYVSIGCAPCTRAIAPGEPERNGRWWWETDGVKECGLHLPRPAATRGKAACG